MKGHTSKIQRIRLTNNDQSLVSIGQDGVLFVWDVFTGLKTNCIYLPNSWTIALGAAKSGRHVAVGGLDNVITVYRIETIEEQMSGSYNTMDNENGDSSGGAGGEKNNNNGIYTGDFNNSNSNNSNKVISATPRKKRGALFQVSPTKSAFGGDSYQMSGVVPNPAVNILKGHQGYISSIEFLTEDKVISGSGDMSVALWDLNRNIKTNEYVDRNLGDVSSVCSHPLNPNIFASASLRTVKLWDVRVKTSLQSFSDHLDDINVVK